MRSALTAAVVTGGAVAVLLVAITQSGDHAPPARGTVLAHLTARLPREVAEACNPDLTNPRNRALRRLTVPIQCPLRVPLGRIVELQESRGPAIFPIGHGGYFMAFITRGPALDDVHWIIAAGRDRVVQRFFWGTGAGSPPRVLAHVRRAGEAVTILRFAPFPRGGQNGGHVAAMLKRHGLTLFASVHGYRYRRIAVDIARGIGPAP